MKLLFLALFPTLVFCQEGFKTQEFISKIHNTTPTPQKVDLYLELIWEYTISGNDSALIYVDKVRDLSQSEDYTLGQVLSLESEGLYYEIVQGDYGRASELYHSAISLCEDNNLDYIRSLYHTLGVMYHTSDSYDMAEKYYNLSYDLAKKELDEDLQKKCLTNLASINSSKEKYKVAEKLFLKSLELAGPVSMNITTYANLGNLYIRQEKYEKAIPWLEKATKSGTNNPNADGNLNFLLDAKAAIKDSLGNDQILQRATRFLDESIDIRDKSLMALSIAQYYQAIGNFKEALTYRDVYLQLYEEVKDKQRDDVVYDLEGKYEAEKKERKITEQQLTILQSERQKNQILIGVVALIVLLFGVFIFFKNKIKYQKTITRQEKILQNNKLIELEQKSKLLALISMIEGQEAERSRIAKDLHDSLGGLLSTVKNYFHTIQKQQLPLEKNKLTDRTNALIDEACMEVRRISHNMMPHSLAISGLKGVIQDVGEDLSAQGYDVTVEVSDTLHLLDRTKEIMIYRLMQEIISNIRKHAQATKILIQVLLHNGQVNIIIEDDGAGFDYDKALKKGGLGLQSIHSRVEFLNGKIYWDSDLNRGSTVSILLPES